MTQTSLVKILSKQIVIIPAYEPTGKILDVVDKLTSHGAMRILIVNDGSSCKYDSIFQKLNEMKHVTLLKHSVNLGKGEALKTAFNHVMVNYSNVTGVITVDCDGQHSPSDVINIMRRADSDSESIWMGCREFGSDVPVKSRIGNILTRNLLSLIVGGTISDTQTGLRYIPKKYIPAFLKLKSGGFAFELDMLIYALKNDITIKEKTIITIYDNNNKGTHFNPFFDSLKVYFLFVRFSMVSLITAVIDFMVFSLVYIVTSSIITSVPAGRLVAGIFNYTSNRKLVFKSKDNIPYEIIKYILLVSVMMALSYGLILVCINVFMMNVFISKVLVESVLFLFSFSMQRTMVFKS